MLMLVPLSRSSEFVKGKMFESYLNGLTKKIEKSGGTIYLNQDITREYGYVSTMLVIKNYSEPIPDNDGKAFIFKRSYKTEVQLFNETTFTVDLRRKFNRVKKKVESVKVDTRALHYLLGF